MPTCINRSTFGLQIWGQLRKRCVCVSWTCFSLCKKISAAKNTIYKGQCLEKSSRRGGALRSESADLEYCHHRSVTQAAAHPLPVQRHKTDFYIWCPNKADVSPTAKKWWDAVWQKVAAPNQVLMQVFPLWMYDTTLYKKNELPKGIL